jgi:hypothetical protein
MRITITIEDTPGGTQVAVTDAAGGVRTLAAAADAAGAIDAGPAPSLDTPDATAPEAASAGRAPARPRTRRSR